MGAAFSRDGKRVVTASSDQTARIWDARTGDEIAVLRGHVRGVRGAVFSPDGTRVVTASADQTARIWPVQPAVSISDLIADATARLPRCLFPNEREAAFLGKDSPAWCTEAGRPPHQAPQVSSVTSKASVEN
jgi:WD40 repeat protein